MGWQERVEKYLKEKQEEEEKRKRIEIEKEIKDREEQGRKEEKRQIREEKLIKINKEKIKPFLEALHKVSITGLLEEIKKEEKTWATAKIFLIPQKPLVFNKFTELKLIKPCFYMERGGYYQASNRDGEDYRPDRYYCRFDSLGVGINLDGEKRMQFYGFYFKTEREINEYDYKNKEIAWHDDNQSESRKEICLANDPEVFQKIEKFLVEKVLESRENK